MSDALKRVQRKLLYWTPFVVLKAKRLVGPSQSKLSCLQVSDIFLAGCYDGIILQFEWIYRPVCCKLTSPYHGSTKIEMVAWKSRGFRLIEENNIGPLNPLAFAFLHPHWITTEFAQPCALLILSREPCTAIRIGTHSAFHLGMVPKIRYRWFFWWNHIFVWPFGNQTWLAVKSPR